MSTIAVPVIENLRPIDVPMIKNGPSMYLNDKKWPIDVPVQTGTPIHVPHFRKKKKGPIDVPGSLILRPMFAAHPYNHFCTEYPPPRGHDGHKICAHTRTWFVFVLFCFVFFFFSF